MFIVRNFFIKCALLMVVLAGLIAQPIHVQAQQQAAAGLDEPKKYELGGITISGARYLDPNTLIGLTGLRVGDPISIPGEEIGKSIRKLWAQGILGDVSVTVARFEGNKIFLDYNLKKDKPKT
jgi:outer membrane protein insertion porin family